jgi:hypothetical protein
MKAAAIVGGVALFLNLARKHRPGNFSPGNGIALTASPARFYNSRFAGIRERGTKIEE